MTGSRAFAAVAPIDARNLLAVGEETIARDLASSSTIAVASGELRLTYFTARKTEPSTQVRVPTGGTAAAATPTLCRIGLYTVAANGNGTLVAAIANDTALFAATFTAYTRTWASPVAKVAGRRYAVGILVVTAAATPTFAGVNAAGSVASEATVVPRLSGTLTGQTDLPASFTDAGLSTGARRYYAAILP